MSKNAKNWFIIIIVILLAGSFWYFTQYRAPAVTVNPPDNTDKIPPSDQSILGCYVAKLSKDVYTLKIESEKNNNVSGMLAFNNYQKDSSAGTFTGTYEGDILLGNYSFDSEGMHSDRQVIWKKVGNNFVEGFSAIKMVNGKEVFEDVSQVTYDPKSTFIQSPNCLEHFIDSNNTISFDYNSFFAATEGDKIPTTDWKVNSTVKGSLLANVFVPRTFLAGTNFGDARLTVGRSNNQTTIRSCSVAQAKNGDIGKGTAVIDGYPFSKFVSSGAGAGNLYETTSYRGIFDGDCYVIEYTIHSSNIGNYSPDQGIKAFDKSKIEGELEKIISSFKFLISSD
ncbi:MAG: hypothetical protein ABIS26_02290 [Candidatus Paceibacterota bacterium]